MDHVLFIHSSADGHLGYFPLLASVKSAAVNIHVQVVWKPKFLSPNFNRNSHSAKLHILIYKCLPTPASWASSKHSGTLIVHRPHCNSPALHYLRLAIFRQQLFSDYKRSICLLKRILENKTINNSATHCSHCNAVSSSLFLFSPGRKRSVLIGCNPGLLWGFCVFFLFFFWLSCRACRILVTWPRISLPWRWNLQVLTHGPQGSSLQSFFFFGSMNSVKNSF